MTIFLSITGFIMILLLLTLDSFDSLYWISRIMFIAFGIIFFSMARIYSLLMELKDKVNDTKKEEPFEEESN